MSGID
jgi:hypothetical protein